MSDPAVPVPAAPAAYDTALAAQLAGLATLANQSLQDLFLPGAWALAFSFGAGGSAGGCQYFLAVTPRAKPTACALVIGAPWSDFISYYTPDDNHLLAQVDPAIVGDATTINADTGFVQMYNAIRGQLWTDIGRIKSTIPAFATTLPLVVAGLGPGAPVAQLAALDLRPGKTNEPSQVASMACYTFSCVPAVDPDFASFYGASVPAGYWVQAAADQFGSQPLPASGYVCAGVQQMLPMNVPTYDSPWVERDGPYYQQLLGGGAAAVPAGMAPVMAGVPGFDPLVAFAMARLAAVPYQMFQHPGSVIAFPTSPYVLSSNVRIGGVVWASLFESPDNLVLAFRGTVSWVELIRLVSNAFPAIPDWISDGYGQYAKPLVDLYGAGRSQLSALLNAASDKPLLLTGHDVGGALANLMAVDLSQHPLQGQRTVAAVYTFGAPPAANPVFASHVAGSALAATSFQVARPIDVMPGLPLLGFLQTVGTLVTLAGGAQDPMNGATGHALTTYLHLLDPGT